MGITREILEEPCVLAHAGVALTWEQHSSWQMNKMLNVEFLM